MKELSFFEKMYAGGNFQFMFQLSSNSVSIDVVDNPNMINTSNVIRQVLNANKEQFRQAYLEDLKSKFPCKVVVSVNSSTIMVDRSSEIHLTAFLSKMFKDAVKHYNKVNFESESEIMKPVVIQKLATFMSQNNWKRCLNNENLNQTAEPFVITPIEYFVFEKNIKDIDMLEITVSQLCHFLS